MMSRSGNENSQSERKTYQKTYKENYKKRHKSVNVTLTLAEYKLLKELAKQQQTKPTTLLKELAFAQMDKQVVYPTELLNLLQEHNRQVRAIGNNLNQLAHSANIFTEVDKKTVFNHLRQLHLQIDNYTKQTFTTNQASESSV